MKKNRDTWFIVRRSHLFFFLPLTQCHKFLISSLTHPPSQSSSVHFFLCSFFCHNHLRGMIFALFCTPGKEKLHRLLSIFPKLCYIFSKFFFVVRSFRFHDRLVFQVFLFMDMLCGTLIYFLTIFQNVFVKELSLLWLIFVFNSFQSH